MWTSWAVYEDFGALIKHAKSEGLRDFASYLTNVNIAVSTKLVFRVSMDHCRGEKGRDEGRRERGPGPTNHPRATRA